MIGMAYPLYVAMPDMFIAPDGKEWAARLDDGRLVVSNLDHDTFTTDQWQQRLGMVPTLDSLELPPDNQQLRCNNDGCVYHHGAHTIAMPITEPALLEDCQHADIIIAHVAVRDCAATIIIDEQALWMKGAHTISFDGDNVRVQSARSERGLRPWSVGWKTRAQQEKEEGEE